jgi:hypothetical protein
MCHNSIIREVKGVGGLDSIGIAYGERAITERVKLEFSSILGRTKTEEVMTRIDSYDNDCATNAYRLYECFLAYAGGNIC